MNNLRLAIGMPSTADCASCNTALQGVATAVDALDAFTRSPSKGSLLAVVARCKTVFEAWGPWLAAQGPVAIDVPEQACVSHLPNGRSAALCATSEEATAILGGRSGMGISMPLLAFGTWGIHGTAAYQAVLEALKVGYRHIDTANDYQNEGEVGRAIRDSGVPREEIFLATKLTQHDCRTWRARDSVSRQLRLLGVEYLDLYMLHQMGDKPSRDAAWQELELLHAEGKIRALGVSNFTVPALEDLLMSAKVQPVYCQNKMSVYAPGEQRVPPDLSLLAYCRGKNIQVMAYSINNPWPLSLPPMQDPHVIAVAARYQKTPAQVLLRWALQMGAGALAKTTSLDRMSENRDIFDFRLAESDLACLTGLATLAESTASSFSPRWVDDVYDLKGLPDLRSLV